MDSFRDAASGCVVVMPIDGMKQDELRRCMETTGDIMRSISSWDQLGACILDMDREGIRTEPGSPQAQIHSLLTT